MIKKIDKIFCDHIIPHKEVPETPCTKKNDLARFKNRGEGFSDRQYHSDLNFVSLYSGVFFNFEHKEWLNSKIDLSDIIEGKKESFEIPTYKVENKYKCPNLIPLSEEILDKLFDLLKIEIVNFPRKIFRYLHPRRLGGNRNDMLAYALYNFEGDTSVLEALAEKFPKDLEIRITAELLKSIWHLQRMNLGNDNVEKIINFILKIEPAVRWQERKQQMSNAEPQKKEFVFNHFLEVMRGSLETIDGMRFDYENYSDEEKEKYKEIFSRDFTITVALASLLHDYIEDKILTRDEIINFLHSSEFFDKKIITRVLELIEIMDFKNYDSHKEYVKTFSSALETLIIKNSDMLKSNFRSGIPKKISFNQEGVTEDPAKNKKYHWYSVFLRYELIHHDKIIKIISKENLDDIKKNNKEEFLKKIFFERITKLASSDEKKIKSYKINIPHW